ncbi:MAG TPA: protein-disulfide reductase DsbD domain-containing protein, partial [Rhodanobacteraceae bacterium]|nr:protein-disulfide reductase DsbD domain-containing protein [Rhodanobacteraceae bacterium]
RFSTMLETAKRVFAIACAAAALPVAYAESDGTEHVGVELISEHASLAPGQSMQLGLLLRHEPHWHTYWINPGDSGLPTTLAWTLPPGLKAQDIAWPLPTRFDVGGLYNFGYDGETLLPITLAVPADAKAGTSAHLAAEAKWLVCREECIPGKASLSLDLPISADPPKPDTRWTKQFARARLALPQATAWKTDLRVDGDRIAIALRGPSLPDAKDLDAFVEGRKIVDNKPPTIRRDGDALIVDFGKSDYFGTPPATLDLVITQPSAATVHGWRVQVPFAATSAAP